VDGLDLAVSRGDILGIGGPDGAGKTTTLRLLAALMNPTAGHAVIFGHDSVRGAARIKAHIGYVAQRFALYGDLTVRENALFYADLFGVPHAERQERLERLLSATDLLRFGERRAAHRSGGMQRKLALACVLIPHAGAHPPRRTHYRRRPRLTPRVLGDPGQPPPRWHHAVISTPYMDEAEQCTRVALMMHGRLAVCDTPARIKAMVPGELVAVWPADMRRAQQALAGLEGISRDPALRRPVAHPRR
jgi:ABC-2 type transport system ATP-binding protein